MALNLTGRLRIIFEVVEGNVQEALNSTERSVNRVARSAKEMGKSAKADFGAVAGAFTTMFVAREVGRVLLGAITPALDLQESLKQLQAETRVTSRELNQLKRAAIDAAAATSFSPTEAIDGLRLLRKRGIDVASAMAVIRPVLQLAQAQTLDVGEATRAAGTLFRSFGGDADELRLAFGQMLVMSTELGFELDNIADLTTKLGAFARNTDMAFSEALITYGLVKNRYASTARAGTSFLQLLQNLATQSKRTALAQEFGIKIIDNSTGRMRNFNDILVAIAESADVDVRKFTTFQDKLIRAGITARATRPLQEAIMELQEGVETMSGGVLYGAEALEYLRKQAMSASDRLDEMAKKVLEGANRAFDELRETIVGVLAEMGQPTADWLGKKFNELAENVRIFRDLVADSKVANWLYTIVLATGGAVVALMLLGGGVRIVTVAFRFAFGPIMRYAKALSWTAVKTTVVGDKSLGAAGRIRGVGLAARGSVGDLVRYHGALTTGLGAWASYEAGSRFALGFMEGWGELLQATGKDVDHLGLSIIKEAQDVGLWTLLMNEATDAAERWSGADIARRAAREANALRDLSSAQQAVNEALQEHVDLLDKAVKSAAKFPPRVQVAELRKIERALRNVNGLTADQRRTVDAAKAAYDEIMVGLREYSRTGEMSAQQSARMEERAIFLTAALGRAGPAFDDQRKRAADLATALAGAHSEGTILNRNVLTAGGLFGETEQTIGRTALQLDKLAEVLEHLTNVMANLEGGGRGGAPTPGRRTRPRREHRAIQGVTLRTPEERIRAAAALGAAGPSALPANVSAEQLAEAARNLGKSSQQLLRQIRGGIPIRVEQDEGDDQRRTVFRPSAGRRLN